MFCDGDQDMVACLEMCLPIGTGYKVQGFAGISGVDDLLFASGVDEVTDDLLRGVVGFRGGNRKDVRASVRIPIFMGGVVQHRIDDGKRALRGGSIIKVDDLMAADLGFQNRKIISNKFAVHDPSKCIVICCEFKRFHRFSRLKGMVRRLRKWKHREIFYV